MYESYLPPIHRENPTDGNAYRLQYLHDLDDLVTKMRQDSATQRFDFGMKIAENREEYRTQFRNMLGWPLNVPASPIVGVEKTPVYEDEKTLIQRVTLEVFEGFHFYGIQMTHKNAGSLPYVIVQHGGSGTPELVGSLIHSGNYNDLGLRVFHRGVNVFMPQLLLWAMPNYGDDDRIKPGNQVLANWPGGNCRRRYDCALRQLGGSIMALEIYCLSRVLDYLETQPDCTGKFGMAGLSYGGFYTLYTSAAEPRLQAAYSCSHFNDRITYNWPDKVWMDSAHTFLDAEVGALVAPRYLRIEVGDNDEMFDAQLAQQEFERLKAYYGENDRQLHFRIFEGKHEFSPENEPVDEFVSVVKNL